MEKRFKCEIGDLVSVDYDGEFPYKWMGLCTWTDGYKYSFLTTEIGEITWTSHDLTHVKAEVINESR
tara:strand:- start:186 stop:386 length:201 start_codon:yes stop_codon:yes gene_type:complete